MVAIQDQMRDNYCWGCGADNDAGLHLKSEWDGERTTATWTPAPEYAAGPRHLVNGGIIATLLDCHGVCTAIADAYRREGRAIGTDPEIWCATASMKVDYMRPTPLGTALLLRAVVVERQDRTALVECVLEASNKDRARALVEAVQVPAEWKHGGSPPAGG